jgi:predicted MFS family arabinose efflux permease
VISLHWDGRRFCGASQSASLRAAGSSRSAGRAGPCTTLAVARLAVAEVQSSFPDKDQGEISGLSRSVSNLGSSLGTALVGSALVAVKLPEGKPFAAALIMLLVITVIGLVLAVLIPRKPIEATEPASPGAAPAASQPTP